MHSRNDTATSIGHKLSANINCISVERSQVSVRVCAFFRNHRKAQPI